MVTETETAVEASRGGYDVRLKVEMKCYFQAVNPKIGRGFQKLDSLIVSARLAGRLVATRFQ